MSLLKILFKDRTHINDGWPGTPYVFGSDCELLVKHHLKKNALPSKFEDSYGYTEKPYPKKKKILFLWDMSPKYPLLSF